MFHTHRVMVCNSNKLLHWSIPVYSLVTLCIPLSIHNMIRSFELTCYKTSSYISISKGFLKEVSFKHGKRRHWLKLGNLQGREGWKLLPHGICASLLQQIQFGVNYPWISGDHISNYWENVPNERLLECDKCTHADSQSTGTVQ